MLTTILIATIIHMNMGYELGEAIARGIGSALILWVVIFAARFIFILIASAVSGLRGK